MTVLSTYECAYITTGNAKIAKDAKESIQECVSEFISFITSEVNLHIYWYISVSDS